MQLHMVSELSISFLVFYTPPPSGTVTLRAVRILLEYILVQNVTRYRDSSSEHIKYPKGSKHSDGVLVYWQEPTKLVGFGE